MEVVQWQVLALLTRLDSEVAVELPLCEPGVHSEHELVRGYWSTAMLLAQATDNDSCPLQKAQCRQSRDGNPHIIR
jgi:hypothetical protein